GSRGGAGFLIYPPRTAAEPMAASLRLEALRDGMEDYAYMSRLEKLLAQREGAVARREIQALIAKLVSGNMEHESINDPLRIQRVRRSIAERIVELQP
ncbi:MAG: DUF4091 domain-containing protein, partial [bacterium]|nr:DUF4091 domain-containing protein [bacterium]